MKRQLAIIGLLLLLALALLGSPLSAVPIEFKAKIRPFYGECDSYGLCRVFVYNGPVNTVGIVCTPEQKDVLMDGNAHEVVLGLLGSSLHGVVMTDVYVIRIKA